MIENLLKNWGMARIRSTLIFHAMIDYNYDTVKI